MDEYISREAVVRYLKGYSEKELNSGSFGMITSSVLNKAERAISEMPAADVQPVNHWISVKDRLPEPYEDVLVCMYLPFRERNKQVVTLSYYLGDDEGYFFEEDAGIRVTHWMPLPEKPEPPKE